MILNIHQLTLYRINHIINPGNNTLIQLGKTP